MTLRALALCFFAALAGCGQDDEPAPDLSAPAIDLTTPIDLAAAGELSAAADLARHEVATCPVTPMDQLYSGFFPPNPYGAIPAADACVDAPHDVIILLGCPNNDDGTAAACQTTRADMAVAFWKAGYADRFITSGAAAHNAYVEAETLRQLLIDRGVAPSQIWQEKRALHTDENLYFSTRIMEAQSYRSAIVVSDDPGHLILSATCDSNCCVDLGRLTVLGFNVAGTVYKAGHYARFPWAAAVTATECSTISFPSKAMCSNLSSRHACAANLQVGDAVDAGM